MSIIGSPSPEFAQPISDSQSLNEAYDLLFVAWNMVAVPFGMSTKNLENVITDFFYEAVTIEKARQMDSCERQYCFSFIPGPRIVYKGRCVGITDIQIQFGNDERRRFILEAKLLNKPKASNAGAYVGTEGMGRFIREEKYGIGVSEGGMMGYVMDKNVDKAKRSVTEKMEKECSSLGMASRGTLKKSSLRDDVYETSHIRHTNVPFTIYHIFLPVN